MARTSLVSTCWPTATFRDVTVPAAGDEMVCCIFIASNTTTFCPASTTSPSETCTAITEPGIGASKEPAATCDEGSGNRGTGRSVTEPCTESTQIESG